MKKTWIVLIISFLVFPTFVMAAEEERVTGEYGTYDNAIKIIQEVMRDYYIKEGKFQYNYSRASYGGNSPEEATIQDTKHLVCASYTYSCYAEAFGVSSSEGFPIYNYSITNAAADYYNTNKDDASKMDGHLLIYYEKTAENPADPDISRYIYNKTGDVTVSEFAQMIQPGDLFTYSGHAMIAYAVVERTAGNWDVLMLNSAASYQVRSRIDGTSRIFYDMFPSPHAGTESVIKVDQQGTVKNFWLSENSKFVKDGKIDCQKAECSVIRPFYKDNDGKAIFNYSILPSKYDKSILRTNYPGLYIEKTVNKIDNNSVYLKDELEYTIKITNKSNSTETGSNYNKFYIVENIDENVKFVSSPTGEKDNDKVVFTINQLAVGETVTLTYKVKVKDNLDNIGKKVQATGKFVSDLDSEVSISTGLVENTIIPTTKKIKKSYQDCYDENKTSKTGLALVNEVYKCAYGEDFHFEDFSFDDMFTKKRITGKGAADAISFKTELDSNTQLYKKMILNNLWSGIVEFDNGSDDGDIDSGDDEISIYTLPRWSGDSAKTRARNIHPQFFKEGDVLIYSVDYSNTDSSLIRTKEDGVYAFIYIGGKFIGLNGTGNTSRNEFTSQYYTDMSLDIKAKLYSGYDVLTAAHNTDAVLETSNYLTLFDKDYYVILRPEMVIKEIAKIDVTEEPSKITYNSTKKKLVMKGGELTYTYNDGSKDTTTLEDDDIEITGYDDTKTGNQTITLSYGGQTTQLLINVGSDTPGSGTGIEVPDTHASKNSLLTIIATILMGMGFFIFGKQFLMND